MSKLSWLSVWFVTFTLGCGGNDAKPEDTEPIPPPALGPDDCAAATGEIAVTQPYGADVWGGLTVVEFEVAGASVDTFDIEYFEPALDAWISGSILRFQGQRADGRYALGFSIVPRPGSVDSEFRVRVRPQQAGCPDAAWTESPGFALSDPLAGSVWTATVPQADLIGELTLEKTISTFTPPISIPLTLGDVELTYIFQEDGVLLLDLWVPLSTAADKPYHECTMVFSFTGTWRMELDRSLRLMTSPLSFAGAPGSICAYPEPTELAVNQPGFMSPVPPALLALEDIDYEPTLQVPPAAPSWLNGFFTAAVRALPQLLAYNKLTELGSVGGTVDAPALKLVKK